MVGRRYQVLVEGLSEETGGAEEAAGGDAVGHVSWLRELGRGLRGTAARSNRKPQCALPDPEIDALKACRVRECARGRRVEPRALFETRLVAAQEGAGGGSQAGVADDRRSYKASVNT